jgi:hypothetical protein
MCGLENGSVEDGTQGTRGHRHPLETFLNELGEIHGSGAGVKETSYYPVLRTLLNDIGKTLKPKVRCIIHLQSKGAGIPSCRAKFQAVPGAQAIPGMLWPGMGRPATR